MRRMTETDWALYYSNVKKDYDETIKYYPFAQLIVQPTITPSIASIRIVAANKDIIDKLMAVEKDFLGDFSREIHIEIPVDYRNSGCIVYGAKWLNLEKIRQQDIHLANRDKHNIWGYQLCVGTPESFASMDNVILECVKTTENMLIAYEKIMIGKTDKLEMKAYDHGERGRRQYLMNKHK